MVKATAPPKSLLAFVRVMGEAPVEKEAAPVPLTVMGPDWVTAAAETTETFPADWIRAMSVAAFS